MNIRSLKHRGLRRLIEDNDGRGIRQDLLNRVRNILTVLILASSMEDVAGPLADAFTAYRRSARHLEHSRIEQLADHVRTGRRRDFKSGFRGLSLMSDSPIRIGMKPSHPGGFIRTEILDPLGLSVAKAATILDVRRATLSDLLNEKAALSPEMALRIEKAFNVSMDTLLSMQAWHDAYTMRQRADDIHVQRYKPSSDLHDS